MVMRMLRVHRSSVDPEGVRQAGRLDLGISLAWPDLDSASIMAT